MSSKFSMMNSKHSKIMTIILIVVIVVILILLGFWAYDVYKEYNTFDDTEQPVEEFKHQVGGTNDNQVDNNTTLENVTNPYDNIGSVSDNIIQPSSGVQTYKGFVKVGRIEIPKTGVDYPVLAEVTKESIENSVAILYGPGLNKPGNTVIVGHNYRNGMFFSDNKKIAIGDKIYITDLEGKRVTYIVYNTYETTAEDSDYMTRDTGGAMEISLSTCTDYDSSRRIIIWAKAE